jgi:type I restriction enzyme R subunit
MSEAGYTLAQAEAIKGDVGFYEKLRAEVKLHSGDAIDLKRYEPVMRHLIDAYIQADGSEQVSAFDDMSLIQLIVARGAAAIDALPSGIKSNHDAVAETIENNVRRLIIDENPINPKYYERMSQLLEALIEQRRREALDYQEYLRRIVELTKQVAHPEIGGAYPKAVNTPGRRALFDNLGKSESLALAIDGAIHASRQDDWRNNPFKIKMVANAVRAAMESAGIAPDDEMMESVMALVKRQDEY